MDPDMGLSMCSSELKILGLVDSKRIVLIQKELFWFKKRVLIQSRFKQFFLDENRDELMIEEILFPDTLYRVADTPADASMGGGPKDLIDWWAPSRGAENLIDS